MPRATPLPPRLRRHLGWPLLLLLACVGVAAVAVVQALREAASHRRTASGLLQDYAEIAAWSYGRRAEEALVEAGRQVLSPILHHELHPRALGGWPDALALPVYRDSALAWCRCAPAFEPDVYFMWTVGAAAATAHVARTDGPAPDPALARRVVDSITAHVRDPRQPRGRAGLVAVPHPSLRPGQARGVALAAYGLMPTEWGDTIAYAFTFDPASLDAGFQRIARDDELLPRAVTRGVPNARLLAVQVAPPAGAAAARAAELSAGDAYPDAAWPYQARVRLAPELAGLRVRAAVRPGAEAALVAGGLPRRGLPLLPALLVLATALALVAVRQLRREQELARLRADFVASVSHELRTPLAQIRLFLETLRLGRWRTAEQRDWLLGHADREATRLSHLVENVLAFARAGRGGQAAAPCAPTDVAAEVRDAADAFAPLAAARGAAVTVRAEGGAHAALDRAAFRQVVLNLLDNAVKYGPAGQTVVVTVARAARDGERGRDEVLVTVDDAGPGVPAAQRRRVWEPFARGDGDHVRAAGGSGIGLSIVREIVARHDGRAWLDDAPGGGLRACVALPACAAASPVAPPDAPDAPREPAPAAVA